MLIKIKQLKQKLDKNKEELWFQTKACNEAVYSKTYKKNVYSEKAVGERSLKFLALEM